MTIPAAKSRALVLPVCAAMFLVLANPCRPGPVSGPASTLPDLTLPEVRGGSIHLRTLPAQPLLIAFLQTVPDTAGTPSRSQAVFLASMAHQYGPRGLRVAIVDASALTRGPQPSHDAVLNAGYDWQLNFPLLLDQNGQLARVLEVKEVPTTFLIAADGTIVQRWQGLTRPAILTQGIERLLGGPLGQVP
ncbi:MAG: TlpA disulfide reductase family protein [Terracidiphilus sp.]|jgi:peroxiredoxin